MAYTRTSSHTVDSKSFTCTNSFLIYELPTGRRYVHGGERTQYNGMEFRCTVISTYTRTSLIILKRVRDKNHIRIYIVRLRKMILEKYVYIRVLIVYSILYIYYMCVCVYITRMDDYYNARY